MKTSVGVDYHKKFSYGTIMTQSGPTIKQGVRDKPDIDGLAVTPEQTVQILLWNYHDDMVGCPPALIKLTVQIPDNNAARARTIHYRIDETHSNAYTRWLKLNSPQDPRRICWPSCGLPVNWSFWNQPVTVTFMMGGWNLPSVCQSVRSR